MTGLYRAPIAGYASGSSGGLAWGVGRGLLGAVGLPLSGALDLVSSVSAGIASTTGISHNPQPKGPGLKLGAASNPLSCSLCTSQLPASTACCQRLAALDQHPTVRPL